MKVMVLGVRALGVQGGVETHAKQLYGELARRGWDIEVLVRSPYEPAQRSRHGVIRIRRLWSPRTSGLEALVHSVLGTLCAGFARPDLLHIHAIGPAIVAPLARLLGLRVIVTHHGPDYARDKWGAFARLTLRLGERLGMRCAHARIAVSRTIADHIRSRFARECDYIPNGVAPAALHPGTDELDRYGLAPRRYFLQVSRLVPEKRQLDLIEAFSDARLPEWKLVLVGAGSDSGYARRVAAAAAAAGPDIVLTGFKNGVGLAQLYSHAGAFVLPSSHEGLPIAMLEALSFGVPVIASDIPANREIGLPEKCYFPVGDSAALGARLASLATAREDQTGREARMRWVTSVYDWRRIAAQTDAVYRRVLGLEGMLAERPL